MHMQPIRSSDEMWLNQYLSKMLVLRRTIELYQQKRKKFNVY